MPMLHEGGITWPPGVLLSMLMLQDGASASAGLSRGATRRPPNASGIYPYVPRDNRVMCLVMYR